jgi:transposase
MVEWEGGVRDNHSQSAGSRVPRGSHEKRACKACEEQGVECAPVPVRIIEKGLASDRVVIDTVVSKYGDHLPLFRQSAILLRETGIDLSRATLDCWVMRMGDLLRAISAAMDQKLSSGSYIRADETL